MQEAFVGRERVTPRFTEAAREHLSKALGSRFGSLLKANLLRLLFLLGGCSLFVLFLLIFVGHLLLLLGEASAADCVPTYVEHLETLRASDSLGDVNTSETEHPVIVHEQEFKLGTL